MTYAGKNIMHGRELIAFRIADQEFCVNVMSVREIRGWTPATAMPHAPSYVLGMINLRGAVLPIVDLSQRLGMKPAEPTVRHVIIVAQVGPKVVGLLVDAVSDILTVTDENIQPTPDIANEAEKGYARGILAMEGRMICLIELDSLFPHTESEAA
jgi:purine-binding chemotaxis protein CheW